MSIDGLNGSNLQSHIDHPKYTTLAKSTITLDDVFQHYFKKSFIEDGICEDCSSVQS